MVNMSYPRKRKLQIYLIAALLAILCCILVACNSDNSYSVAGENVSEPTHFMAKFMITINNALGGGVASFGWTVVLFTVILRLILSPLDIWQKVISRRNNKAMERMKPQLEALQARYADDKQRLQQEQMALYKKEKYSTMGMCLPTIVTFVVFFVVFAGFRQMVGYQFAKDYKECVKAYNTSIAEQIEANKDADYIVDNGDGKWDIDDVAKTESGADFYAAAKKNAQQAVYNVYYSEDQVTIRSFLWIKNIFVSDNWAQAVPDFATVTGQKGMATSKLTGITIDEYNDVMAGCSRYGRLRQGRQMERLAHSSHPVDSTQFPFHKIAFGLSGTTPCASAGRSRRGCGESPVATTNHEDDAIRHAHNDGRVRTVLFGCVCALYVHKFVMRDSVPAHFQSYRKTRR